MYEIVHVCIGLSWAGSFAPCERLTGIGVGRENVNGTVAGRTQSKQWLGAPASVTQTCCYTLQFDTQGGDQENVQHCLQKRDSCFVDCHPA